MPQDDQSNKATEERIKAIRAEVAYYKAACVSAAGHFTTQQPPTIYAAKYVEDMEFLLGQLQTAEPVEEAPAPKTELEKALDHDAAGRVERMPRKR